MIIIMTIIIIIIMMIVMIIILNWIYIEAIFVEAGRASLKKKLIEKRKYIYVKIYNQ